MLRLHRHNWKTSAEAEADTDTDEAADGRIAVVAGGDGAESHYRRIQKNPTTRYSVDFRPNPSFSMPRLPLLLRVEEGWVGVVEVSPSHY